MNKRSIITHKKGYKPALDVEGVYVVELASKETTGGLEFSYQYGGRGEGAPAHSHNWDEAFFILKGSAIFRCGEQKEVCTAGSLIFVPGGMTHSFEFGENGCEFLDVAGLGSNAIDLFKKIAAEHHLLK